MQGRSWMAVLALAAASAALIGPAAIAGEPTPIKQAVKLRLRVDGVARDDAEVVIKPGHPGCRFKEVSFRVGDQPRDRSEMFVLAPIEVESISADRDCSFAITIKEPGKPDKTVRRNLVLAPSVDGRAAAPQELRCFVSSTTEPVARKAEEMKRKK